MVEFAAQRRSSSLLSRPSGQRGGKRDCQIFQSAIGCVIHSTNEPAEVGCSHYA
jgi:hypothetical protein